MVGEQGAQAVNDQFFEITGRDVPDAGGGLAFGEAPRRKRGGVTRAPGPVGRLHLGAAQPFVRSCG